MKIFNKTHLPLVILVILYLVTRLHNLLLLPIFTDESIYIYWAKIIATTHSQWGISLTDGKPPLLVWMIAFFLQILPSHWYLLAGRLPSVISGGIALWGTYKLTKLLFNSEKTALFASLIYICSPFILFYDRMALFDSLLTAMTLWSAYFALKTAKTHNIKDVILWGLFLGLAYLSKPTAAIFLFLTPSIYVIFKGKDILHDWKKSFLLMGIPLFMGELINNLQRFSHVYYLMAAKNQQFQQPWDKLLKDPFALTWSNLHGFFGWIIPYYTLPIFIIGLLSLIVILFTNRKIGLVLIILWFAPIFILSTVGREIFPRYILFTTPYFLIAIAYFIVSLYEKASLLNNQRVARARVPKTSSTVARDEENMDNPNFHRELYLERILGNATDRTRVILILFSFLILFPSLRFDYLLLTDPPSAPLPDSDYHQYISEHPSGYGLDKIYAFLNQELKKGTVNLIVQGTFGLYPYAFYLEYWDNPNLKINPRWPLSSLEPDILVMAKSTPTYILLKEYDKIPDNLPLKLVLKAEKPGGKYPILLTTLK